MHKDSEQWLRGRDKETGRDWSQRSLWWGKDRGTDRDQRDRDREKGRGGDCCAGWMTIDRCMLVYVFPAVHPKDCARAEGTMLRLLQVLRRTTTTSLDSVFDEWLMKTWPQQIQCCQCHDCCCCYCCRELSDCKHPVDWNASRHLAVVLLH